MCDDCDNNSSSGSSFIFGIFLGAIIGAIVAIHIYKNNKTDIIETLKDKFESFFKEKSKIIKSKKISVTIPKKVESIDLTPPRPKKPAKMFVKK